MVLLATILLLLPLTSSIVSAAEASDKPTCTIRGLSQNCDFFSTRKQQAILSLPDGTWFSNPSFEGKRVDPPQLDTDKRFKRAKELFEYAKTAVLDEISKGQPLDKLTTEERALMKKVETLKLNSLSVSSKSPSCADMAPDAYYSGEDHSVTLCAGMLHYPDAQLIKVIGHEIGHPIDPCSSRFPLVRINGEALKKLSDLKSSWPDSIRNNSDVAGAVVQIKKYTPSEYAMFSQIMNFRDPKSINYLTENLILSEVAPAIEAEKHPAQGAYSCLIRTKAFREVSAQDIKLVADRFAQSNALDQPDSVVQDLSSKVEKRLRPYSQCIWSAGGRSQMGEAMSDVWGAKVFGRWLTDNPPKSEVEKVAAISLHAAGACRQVTRSQPDLDSLPLNKITESADRQIQKVHPSDFTRADLIVLADPRAQQALGCQSTDTENCLKLVGRQGPFRSGQDPTAVPTLKSTEAIR